MIPPVYLPLNTHAFGVDDPRPPFRILFLVLTISNKRYWYISAKRRSPKPKAPQQRHRDLLIHQVVFRHQNRQLRMHLDFAVLRFRDCREPGRDG